MKYRENCEKCSIKKGCNKFRPISLSDTLNCIATSSSSGITNIICKRSNFLQPAIDALVANKKLLAKVR